MSMRGSGAGLYPNGASDGAPIQVAIGNRTPRPAVAGYRHESQPSAKTLLGHQLSKRLSGVSGL